jgi:prepilin-type N-terminal cleavage/methylation domain-containing protein
MTMRQILSFAPARGRHPASRKLKAQGFTLIEIIVILAVISILVAIMTPTVLKYIQEAQLNRAEEDVKIINAALNDLIKDTGQYPGSKASQNFICGDGTIATAGATGWAASSAVCSSLTNHLVINDPDDDGTAGEANDDYRTSGKFSYKGPYAQSLNQDPWGNAYEVNASTLVGGNTSPTWIISAGPDGTLDTATTATTLSNDDIGVRIK